MNRLGLEKSPYLLQHKDNPVHWFAWGEEAFQAAREENKPIFLSIGYSTCYWCHMMEKDSFELQEVADALNKNFISIKVDREEHPDVDQIYMDAVIGMTGQGGWPMSVFLTPDLKPFWGGTFFWRAQFLQILSQLSEAWKKSPEKVFESAEQITSVLKSKNKIATSGVINDSLIQKAFEQFEESFDSVYGGFGQAPKFPHSTNLLLLLKKNRLEMVVKTLDAMADGEIFDKIGGGFHRYATQDNWNEPHYEKMLYDNALLASVYLEAFQITQNKKYAEVAKQTLDYVLREMTHPDGGFYSAQDAGDVGKEGDYYHGTVEERAQKMPPHKDDKILTAWNGLMIAAMAKHNRQAAKSAAEFIRKHLYKNGKLLRRFRDGDARFEGTLEDYAFFIHGLLALGETDWACQLQAKQDQIFWDPVDGGYFSSDPTDKTLIVAKKEFHDGALPSANAITALNLLKLFEETCDEKFIQKAEQLLKQIAGEANRYPAGFATGLLAIDLYLNRPTVCKPR